MRKVEEMMNAAVVSKSSRCLSNTQVTYHPESNVSTIHLHGNLIARFYHGDAELELFDGGWQSNTTKSRLNALLSRLTSYYCGVAQRKFTWYFISNADQKDFVSGMKISTRIKPEGDN